MNQNQSPQNTPPYGQAPSGPPRYSRRPGAVMPVVTYTMIALCILAYIIQMALGNQAGVDLLTAYGAKINEFIIAGEYWRLITPVFLHGNLYHILFNMYALFVFGANLERYYGHWRFLLLYMLGGFAGNVVSFLMSPNPSLGSSTAIFALISAQAVFLFQNRELIRNARGMLMNTLVIAGINLVLGLSPGIDNWGHLGGLLGGLAFAWSAGPVWSVQSDLNGVRLVNQRTSSRVLVVAVGVFILFAVIAAAKIINA